MATIGLPRLRVLQTLFRELESNFFFKYFFVAAAFISPFNTQTTHIM
jgi:hypothetical protein